MAKNVYVADFETYVSDDTENQKETWVWSAAFAELFDGTDSVNVLGNIGDFVDYFIKLRVKKTIVYFHNLKFDGTFIVNYLLSNNWQFRNKKNSEMLACTFKTLISNKNRWYTLTLKTSYGIIEFRDSAKLIPISLRDAGKAFGTKYQKLEMEYVGFRPPNCFIAPEELLYIKNDVLVLKELMEIFYSKGFTKLTIGSCCMNEFKKSYDKQEYFELFPDLRNQSSPFFALDTDDYVRATYKGAWCYVKEPGEYFNGSTYDVNGLYSFVMHSSSGNYYPVGYGNYFQGAIPPIALKNNNIYFIHIKCKFKLKKGFLPTIQIKNSFLYKANEWLETSDIFYKGKYYHQIDIDGKIYDSKADLYLTCVDFELLKKHYNVEDLEILDGVWFNSQIGLFDDYINHWQSEKQNAENKVKRLIAKLLLNNNYGKFATSRDSSYRVPFLEDGTVEFDDVEEFDKLPGYIPIGSMVTSYARYWTVTHAQKNYQNFIYADTDSLHLIGDCGGLEIHPKKLGAWKKESEWSKGIFLRQKCYAEFIRIKDGEKVNPRWSIICAGLPDKGKDQFLKTHPITDFKYGLHIPKCKLVPKNIKGGVILKTIDFTLYKR